MTSCVFSSCIFTTPPRSGFFPTECAAPSSSGARIGSGGATLNALLIGARALFLHEQRLASSSAVPSADHADHEDAAFGDPAAAYCQLAWLATRRFLVLHSGGDSQRLPICSVRGKAFCTLPSETSTAGAGSNGTGAGNDTEDAQSDASSRLPPQLNAPIDFLLRTCYAICAHAPRGGCFVACTDVLLLLDTTRRYVWPADGACGLAILAPKELGPSHGVFHVAAPSSSSAACSVSSSSSSSSSTYANDEFVHAREVAAFAQKGTVAQLEAMGAVDADGRVLLDSGLVHLRHAHRSNGEKKAHQSWPLRQIANRFSFICLHQKKPIKIYGRV
jgi:hypothetical protein